MKKHYYFLFILLLSTKIIAQFGPPQFINSPTDTQSSKQFIRVADVDDDGKKDILVGSKLNNLVRYFHNEGNFTFAAPVLLPGTWSNLIAMEVADVDTNGTPDVLTYDLNAQSLYWQSNINGIFSGKTLIKNNLSMQDGRIICRDFNGDSVNDIVILNHLNVLLFINNGNGIFAEPQNLLPVTAQTEIYDVVAGYFNNDAFLDLAIAKIGFSILLNDGLGNFSQVPTNYASGISFLLESADYNNDGLSDILIDTTTLKHFQNSGAGFTNVGTFTPNNENYETLFSADLDNDGDLDVLSEDNQTTAFFWYENVNGGSSWIRHTISIANMFSSLFGVSAADLDNDGDVDLIRTSGNGEVALYENQLFLKNAAFKLDRLILYPNPAASYITIGGLIDGTIDLEIYDLLGKKIAVHKNVSAATIIPISNLNIGTYLVKLIDKKEVEIRKLLVTR